MGVFYAVLTSIFLSVSSVPYVSLEKAIESNNPQEIVQLSKQKVLIDILGDEGVYGHPQAVLVLKNFFSLNPKGSFNYTFKGSPSNEGAFAIGNYASRGNKFRITIHFKKIDNKFKVESLMIEK